MTYTRSQLPFKAGENAPSPVDVLGGQPIINNVGNIALYGIEEDGFTVILDETVEPPVLKLAKAIVRAEMGKTEDDGSFKRDMTYAAEARVSGIYHGPGSVLDFE